MSDGNVKTNPAKRAAIIGDPHGCLDELVELHAMLAHHSLDGIFHVGDLVDRGPDSGGVVQFCREQKIEGVLGNHEGVILSRRESQAQGRTVSNEDKRRTLASMRSEEDWAYLNGLPWILQLTELNTVLVHSGLWPSLPLSEQPWQVACAQMIKATEPGRWRWKGTDRRGQTEVEARAEGWQMWYEVYDQPSQVVFGHAVFPKPFIYDAAASGGGRVVGIETGCVFGGWLTALILPDFKFVSVRAKRSYFGAGWRDYEAEAAAATRKPLVLPE